MTKAERAAWNAYNTAPAIGRTSLADFLAGHRAAWETVERLAEQLEWLQWWRLVNGTEIGPLCPECERTKEHGHATDCTLKAALDAARGE